MTVRFAPLFAALLAVGLTASPARADDTADAVAASTALIKDAHAVTGLALESLDALEAIAGDAATRATVTGALAHFNASKPEDAKSVKALASELATVADGVRKAGLKPHALDDAEKETLRQGLLKANAAALIAQGEAARAGELAKQAGTLIMANPFGAMSLKPISDNAAVIAGLASSQASALQSVAASLGSIAATAKVELPTAEEIQAFAQSVAPAAGL